MANPLVEVFTRVAVSDASGTREWSQPSTKFGLGVGAYEVVQDLTLTGSADTVVSVPTGAKAVFIRPGTAVSLSIKGATGDGNLLTVTPASNPIAADMFLTLGASPVLVIHNGSAATQAITLVFL
jgi:hypothetical protein